jgi:hypothetical protein
MLVAQMLSSGIAHADGDDFLRALHQQGIKDSGGDQAMIKLGRIIGDLRSDGYRESQGISARSPVISWRATWR